MKEITDAILALHQPLVEDGQAVGCATCDWAAPGNAEWPCATVAALGDSNNHPGWDEVMVKIGAKQERERLMDLLDAETITHQERGQIAVRQWARAWIREQ